MLDFGGGLSAIGLDQRLERLERYSARQRLELGNRFVKQGFIHPVPVQIGAQKRLGLRGDLRKKRGEYRS